MFDVKFGPKLSSLVEKTLAAHFGEGVDIGTERYLKARGENTLFPLDGKEILIVTSDDTDGVPLTLPEGERIVHLPGGNHGEIPWFGPKDRMTQSEYWGRDVPVYYPEPACYLLSEVKEVLEAFVTKTLRDLGTD